MKKVVIAQVGADGVLALTLPLGEAEANRTVRVTVETVEGLREPTLPQGTHEDWLKFIDSTTGKWQGELARPPQGEYEKRDDWP